MANRQQPLRFAVGGISTESNGFVSQAADEKFLLSTGFIKEDEAVFELLGLSSEVGGAINYLQTHGGNNCTIVPTVAARGNSGGPLAETIWRRLLDGIVTRVAAAEKLDGVLLTMHGAMSVGLGGKADSDPEGTLAFAVRQAVGAETVIVMTLDLHANVTELMAQQCDAIVSYDHYPHDDIVRTGERGAALMLKAARGEVKLGMAVAKLNMLQTAYWCKTNFLAPQTAAAAHVEGIGGRMLRRAKKLENVSRYDPTTMFPTLDGGSKFPATVYDTPMLDPHDGLRKIGSCHYGESIAGTATVAATAAAAAAAGSADVAAVSVLSTSINWCYPYTDFANMGNTAIVIVDLDFTPLSYAEKLAKDLMQTMFNERASVPVFPSSVSEALSRGRTMDGPVLLLDTADCAGGGAAGDSVQLVKALLDAGAGATASEQCVAMVVDADAAAKCVAAGEGAEVELALGHTIDSSSARAAAGLPPWGVPLSATGRVVAAKANATFEYTGGVLGGTTVSMGASAVWVVGGCIHVLIMTTATYDWADEQYRCMGIDPQACKFIAVKNMMNFRLGYAAVTDVEANAIVLDVQGPTPPAMSALPFRRLKRDEMWLPPATKDATEVVSEPLIRIL